MFELEKYKNNVEKDDLIIIPDHINLIISLNNHECTEYIK